MINFTPKFTKEGKTEVEILNPILPENYAMLITVDLVKQSVIYLFIYLFIYKVNGKEVHSFSDN